MSHFRRKYKVQLALRDLSMYDTALTDIGREECFLAHFNDMGLLTTTD